MSIGHPKAVGNPSVTAACYDRTSWFYDPYDLPMDTLGGVRWHRRRLLAHAYGRVLEVGVGTGRNLGLYPAGVQIVGIAIARGMLDQARRHADTLGADKVTLQLGDVQSLPFADDAFDTVAASCVFCSVDDPVAGLREIGRVVKPSGQVLLLEHVRPRTTWLARLFDLISPLSRRTLGFHVNRDTERNVRAAGLRIERTRQWGIWREIVASRPR